MSEIQRAIAFRRYGPVDNIDGQAGAKRFL
jgi:hypothetical protein